MPAPKPNSRPRSRQWAISVPAASRIAIAILTARWAGSEQGTGSLKNTMMPSPENWSSVPCSDPAQRAMVLTQEVEHVLRLSGLGEGGVTAQIAEHDNDLAPVAFEDALLTLCDDHLGQLRCEKAFQPSYPAEFLNLLRDPRL